jgi:hypothetical protein
MSIENFRRGKEYNESAEEIEGEVERYKKCKKGNEGRNMVCFMVREDQNVEEIKNRWMNKEGEEKDLNKRKFYMEVATKFITVAKLLVVIMSINQLGDSVNRVCSTMSRISFDLTHAGEDIAATTGSALTKSMFSSMVESALGVYSHFRS